MVKQFESFLTIGDDDDGKFTECCHDDVLHRREQYSHVIVYVRELSHPCMMLSPGSPIVAICTSSNIAISAAYVHIYTHWSDFGTNIDVIETAMVNMLLKTQLRWAGHVSYTYQRSYCMENCSLAIVTKGHLGKDTKTL